MLQKSHETPSSILKPKWQFDLSDTFHPETVRYMLELQLPHIESQIKEQLIQVAKKFRTKDLGYVKTADVLNPKDYPAAYNLALEELNRLTDFERMSRFAQSPIDQHPIERHFERPSDKISKAMFVKPNKDHPICFRYEIQGPNKTTFGDIFVLPTFVKRLPFEAVSDGYEIDQFETMIVAVDALADKKIDYKPTHRIEIPLPTNRGTILPIHDTEVPKFFVFSTPNSFDEPQIAELFSDHINDTLYDWMMLHKNLLIQHHEAQGRKVVRF